MNSALSFEDIIYEVRERAAWIIINRPKLYNAFRAKTIEELINSVVRAEDHAREQEKIQASALERQYPLRRFEWRQEMVEVA